MTRQEQLWLWLSSVEGIGAKRFHRLLEEFVDLENLWNCTGSEIKRLDFLGPVVKQRLLDSRKEEYVESLIHAVERAKCRVVTMVSPGYPRLLAEIYDPPPVLYVKGGSIDFERAIAVVGTRACTRVGRDTAKEIGRGLSQAGVTVVSGMARGIDTSAHIGALEGGSPTIAVLGCGVDVVYPAENREYYEMIIQQGAVVSEYPPGMKPVPANFPARNRIISGLSRATVVVESPKKSGTMITVDFAQEQGRDVFAVPGSILSKTSEGTNALIKECAYILTDVNDILEEYGWTGKQKMVQETFLLPETENPEEKAILAILKDGEYSYEELQQISRLSAKALNSALTMMELKGMIEEYPGKLYKLKR